MPKAEMKSDHSRIPDLFYGFIIVKMRVNINHSVNIEL
jgi:hypothetical protein